MFGGSLVIFFTHISGGTLDLILVRSVDKINSLEVYNESNDILLSDHFMIKLSLSTETTLGPGVVSFRQRETSKLDQDAFLLDFSSRVNHYREETIHNRQKLHDSVNNLFSSLSNSLDIFAPNILRSKKTFPKTFFR